MELTLRGEGEGEIEIEVEIEAEGEGEDTSRRSRGIRESTLVSAFFRISHTSSLSESEGVSGPTRSTNMRTTMERFKVRAAVRVKVRMKRG